MSDIAIARRSDPDTSHEAAAKVANITELKRQILRVLRNAKGPMTDEAIYRIVYYYTNCTDSSCRTRRNELKKDGLVVKVDREGKTRNGNACSRWGLA